MDTLTDLIEMRKEVARIGEQIYDRRLKSLLEPQHDGRIVAIHIPTEDYFLGDSLLEVSDRLRERYPGASRGEVYSRGVGWREVIVGRAPRVGGDPK